MGGFVGVIGDGDCHGGAIGYVIGKMTRYLGWYIVLRSKVRSWPGGLMKTAWELPMKRLR